MKARDLMASNPEVLVPEDSVGHAASVMKNMGIGALPVVEDRSGMRLTGILTDRDITLRHVAESHGDDCEVQRHMTGGEGPSEFAAVQPGDGVETVMELMVENKVRRVPVIANEGEELVGIVALADIAREVGPEDPDEVVRVLEAISEPA